MCQYDRVGWIIFLPGPSQLLATPILSNLVFQTFSWFLHGNLEKIGMSIFLLEDYGEKIFFSNAPYTEIIVQFRKFLQ